MHKGQNKSVTNKRSSRKEELLEAEVKRLREELKAAKLEKGEINSEYEKLSTICRSQRQQLHGIKQALASASTPNETTSKTHSSPGIQLQGLFNKSSSSPDQNSWQAFPEDLKTPTLVTSDNSKPVITKNSHQNRSGAAGPAARSPVIVPVTNLNQSQRFGGLKNNERNLTSQPPGWAAF